MRTASLAPRLISIALAFTCPAIVLAQQSKVIELVATDGGAALASIRVNDQNLLFESTNGSEAFLFTPEALVAIKHKEKTYSIQRYDDLQVMVSRRAGEIAKSEEARDTTDAGSDGALRLIGETDTIHGLKVRKLIKMSNGKPEAEIWVSSDLVPTKLRAAGERLRSTLPKDYWAKLHGNPGMIEIIMLFGIPMKMVIGGREVYLARVLEKPVSSSSFEVPSGYTKTGN